MGKMNRIEQNSGGMQWFVIIVWFNKACKWDTIIAAIFFSNFKYKIYISQQIVPIGIR